MPIDFSAATEAPWVIQGYTFTGLEPFKEGHVCSPNEAAALNQLLLENVRNNFRRTVEAAKEAAAANGTEVDTDTLQAELTKYIHSYEFGGSRRSSSDPVEAEAMRLATDMAKDLIRGQGKKIGDYTAEQIRGIAERVLEKVPGVREKARTIVEARQSTGLAQMEGMDLL